MSRLNLILAVALSLVILAGQASADFLIFDLAQRDDWFALAGLNKEQELKQIDTVFVLPGQVNVSPGTFAMYRRESGAPQVQFRLQDVKFIRAPTARREFNNRLSLAGKNPDAVMQAAIWGMKAGSLVDFDVAVDKAREIDPAHPIATRLASLRQELKKTLPDDPESERKLRALMNRDGMRIESSNHFLLLTDTEAEPPKGIPKSRSRERLELLEKTYESFLLLFCSQNVQLDIPRGRLPVVLFKNRADFRETAKRLNPKRPGEIGDWDSGFWDAAGNVCCFCDGGGRRLDLLARLSDKIKEIGKNDAKKARDPELIRSVKLLTFLADAEREVDDAAAVSNFCSRQMAANTGLLPRETAVPRWVQAGLATYFEVPVDAALVCTGAVTASRLNSYRELAWKDLSRSNFDFIVTDKIFSSAKQPEDQHAAAGQAWALTHFLMERHFAEFAAFCRLLSKRTTTAAPDPGTKKLFSQALAIDDKTLNLEWHKYMDSLKTELEMHQLESEKELLKQRMEKKR